MGRKCSKEMEIEVVESGSCPEFQGFFDNGATVQNMVYDPVNGNGFCNDTSGIKKFDPISLTQTGVNNVGSYTMALGILNNGDLLASYDDILHSVDMGSMAETPITFLGNDDTGGRILYIPTDNSILVPRGPNGVARWDITGASYSFISAFYPVLGWSYDSVNNKIYAVGIHGSNVNLCQVNPTTLAQEAILSPPNPGEQFQRVPRYSPLLDSIFVGSSQIVAGSPNTNTYRIYRIDRSSFTVVQVAVVAVVAQNILYATPTSVQIDELSMRAFVSHASESALEYSTTVVNMTNLESVCVIAGYGGYRESGMIASLDVVFLNFGTWRVTRISN